MILLKKISCQLEYYKGVTKCWKQHLTGGLWLPAAGDGSIDSAQVPVLCSQTMPCPFFCGRACVYLESLEHRAVYSHWYTGLYQFKEKGF
jgi:hypothetical protein